MREEILTAAREVASGNPWYTSDQLGGQAHGVYRHNMELRYRYVKSRLKRMKLDGNTVVDLGCGDGQWSLELSRQANVQLIGVDYNELRLDRYRRNLPSAEARFGSCLEIPLSDGSADVVMFHQVLEHLAAPAVALQEIRRILRPNGWLMLSVPNEGTWLKQKIQYKFIEPNALATSDHVNFYTRSSLRSVLETNGFLVTQLDALGFYFPHNGISRRIIESKVVFKAATMISLVVPALRDCLFAWCQPANHKSPGARHVS